MAARDASTKTILRELRLVMERLTKNDDMPLQMRQLIVKDILVPHTAIDLYSKGVPAAMALKFAMGEIVMGEEE